MLKSETYTLLHGKKDTHKRISKKKNSKLLTPSYAHTKFGKDFPSVYLAYSNLAGIFDVAGTAEGARAAES